MQFILDSAMALMGVAGVYVAGCYTPKTWEIAKARVLAWVAKLFRVGPQ